MAAAAEGAAGGAPSPRRSTEKTKRAVGLEGAGENGDWDVFSLSLSLSPSLSTLLPMARKKVREYDAKRMLKAALARLAGVEMPLKAVQV